MAYSVFLFPTHERANATDLCVSKPCNSPTLRSLTQINHTLLLCNSSLSLFSFPFFFFSILPMPLTILPTSTLYASMVLLCFLSVFPFSIFFPFLYVFLLFYCVLSLWYFVFGGIGAVGRGEFVSAVELWKATGRNLVESTVDNSSLILAETRTQRKDPLNNFQRYTGGWNIKNKHYWAVSFFLI